MRTMSRLSLAMLTILAAMGASPARSRAFTLNDQVVALMQRG